MTSRTHPSLAAAVLMTLAAAPVSAAEAVGNPNETETYAVVAAADAALPAEAAPEATALAPEADTLPATATASAALRAPASPGSKAQPVVELPEKSATAKRTGPGKESILKFGASPHETPRSLTVMSAERIKEQNFTNANSTFNYTPGVFGNAYGSGGYHFYSRGQRMAAVDNRVDGFAGIAAGGDFSPSLFGIDHTVMLRGPASLTYGTTGAPGGMINLISKKPEAARSTRLSLDMGPYGGSTVGFNDGSSFGAEIDATGTLTDDGKVLYRAQGRFENQRHFTADVMDRNRYANLALTYRLDGAGKYLFTPMVQTTLHDRPAGRGLVISPSGHLDDRSSLDVNHSAGGRVDETFMAGADFKADVSGAWKVNGAYRYFTYDTDLNQFAPVANTLRKADPADDRSWTIQRLQTKSITERFNHGFDANAIHEAKPASLPWLKNMAQLGFNARITGTDRSASATGANQSPINIYTGVAPALRDSVLALKETFNNTSYQWNVYLQDQASFLGDRFVATLGLGYMQEHLDRDYSRTADAKAPNLGDILATRYGEPTVNLALMHNVTGELGLYASYATSYSLPAGDIENKAGVTGEFDPTMGINYELGAKYDVPALAASLTGAWFWTETKNNLIQVAPTAANPKGYYLQLDGEGRRGTGVEVSGEISPLANWRLSAGGAYIDVINRSSVDKVADGSRGDKVPEWSGNLFSRYDLAAGPMRGLGASLGVIYQGERLSALKTAAAPNPLVMPWFTRVDLGLYYRVNASLDVALNVENLANDERIVYGGTTGANIELGSPRRATVRTTYRM